MLTNIEIIFISGQSDFESLMPIRFVNEAEIRIFTSNDEITLEYDDSVILTFTPDNPALIPGLEAHGEYVRDTVTVYIIDNDSECSISVLIASKLFLISQGCRLILRSLITPLKRVEL